MAEILAQAACADVAEKLSKVQLSKKAIEIILLKIYLNGDRNGYDRKAREITKIRDSKERRLKEAWDLVLEEIDDLTHGGQRNKKQ